MCLARPWRFVTFYILVLVTYLLICVCVVTQVRVMLRVCPVDAGRSSFLSCNEHLRHVTVMDQSVCGASAATSPATARRRPAAPKTFAFDTVFTQDTSLVSTLYYQFLTIGTI